MLVDLAMARHRGRLACRSVDVHRVTPALPEQRTTVRLQVADQVDALHARPPLRAQLQRLADDVLPGEFLLGEHPVCLEHELDRLTEVRPRFVERCPLRIGARKLLDERDIPLRDGTENSGQLDLHGHLDVAGTPSYPEARLTPNARVKLRAPTGGRPDDSIAIVARVTIRELPARQLERLVSWRPLSASAEREKRGILVGHEREYRRLMALEQLNDLRRRTVAEPNPNDLRREAPEDAQPVKVLVFRHEDEPVLRRMLPDGCVWSSLKADILEVGRARILSRQGPGEPWR